MSFTDKDDYGRTTGVSKSGVKVIGAIIVSILAFGVLLIVNPITKISAGERGVVLHWGAVQSNVLGEGIHWVTPIAQDVEKMPVTIQKVEKEASASSKDLQMVHTKIALNYNLNPNDVDWIYQNFRKEYQLRLIEPAIEEYMKAATAKYTAEELITKREIVKDLFKHTLADCLAKSGIVARDVFITDFTFNPEFDKAIEEKVTAEQNALREKNVLERKKYEAEQVVVKAKADAEAIRIQAQAITQQGGKDYVNLKAVEKWDGALPTYMIPSGALPFLSLEYAKK